MNESLRQIRSYALSNDDINEILEPDTKVFTYPEFAKMSNINEAFDNLGRCVFLFLTESESMGHWVCMFKRDGHIEYFSSYGDKPEAEREWVNQEQLEKLGQGQPYLLDLLQRSKMPVYVSTYPYQSDRKDISTCGRWCVARLICKELTHKQFYNLVKDEMKRHNIKSMDDFVSMFTYDILGK